jgi:hypothetical protein
MIPISRACDVETIQDFSRYYGNSWVGWHPTDAAHIQPMYVGSMRNNNTEVTVRALSKLSTGFEVEGYTYINWQDLKDHIDFGLPPIGMYREGPTFVYAAYSSPRSPRKGYRPRDLHLCEFNSWAIRKNYARGSRDSYDWVWHTFNPEYPPLAKAIETLNSGESVGVPISRTLGVYTLPNYRYPMLAYKRWNVGYVVDYATIMISRQFGDYAGDIANQTGAKVTVL